MRPVHRLAFVRHAAGVGGLLAIAALWAGGCSQTPRPAAGLELIIVADGLSAPADFDDIQLQVSQQSHNGSWNEIWNHGYDVPSPEATLPTTFAVIAGQSADQEVLIVLTAFKGGRFGQPVVQRVAQVQAPTDRVAALWLVLAEVCRGQVAIVGAEGEPTSTCPSGQSCQPSTGGCGTSVISNPSSLPTYAPGESLDAAPEGSVVVQRGEAGGGGDAAQRDATIDASLPTYAPGESLDAAPKGSVVVQRGEAGGGGDAAQRDATIDADSDVDSLALLDGGACGANGDVCCQGSTPCAIRTDCCDPSSGTCMAAGQCPSVLASGLGNSEALVIDSTSLYWPDRDGTVMKLSLDGGAPIAIVSGVGNAEFIAVDSAYIYWTNSTCFRGDAGDVCTGTIIKAPLSGGQPATIASTPGLPEGIAVDSTNVYWTNWLSVYGGNVLSVGLDGGAVTTVAPNPGGVESIIATAGNLYWTGSGGLTRMPLGGSPTTLAADCFGAAMVLDSVDAYWVCQGQGGDSGSVMKAALDGSSGVTVVSGQGPFGGIAVDFGSIYWTNGFGDHTVMRVPIDGGTPTMVATGKQPWAIAVDSTSVYWTDDGILFRIAKSSVH